MAVSAITYVELDIGPQLPNCTLVLFGIPGGVEQLLVQRLERGQGEAGERGSWAPSKDWCL